MKYSPTGGQMWQCLAASDVLASRCLIYQRFGSHCMIYVFLFQSYLTKSWSL